MFDRVTLVDADSEVRSDRNADDRYRTITADLMHDRLPGISGEVVIADPPRYLPEIRAFLWGRGVASSIVLTGVCELDMLYFSSLDSASLCL